MPVTIKVVYLASFTGSFLGYTKVSKQLSTFNLSYTINGKLGYYGTCSHGYDLCFCYSSTFQIRSLLKIACNFATLKYKNQSYAQNCLQLCNFLKWYRSHPTSWLQLRNFSTTKKKSEPCPKLLATLQLFKMILEPSYKLVATSQLLNNNNKISSRQ